MQTVYIGIIKPIEVLGAATGPPGEPKGGRIPGIGGGLISGSKYTDSGDRTLACGGIVMVRDGAAVPGGIARPRSRRAG